MDPTGQVPSADQIPILLSALFDQIEFARQYAKELIDSVPRERWYEIPMGQKSHLAWQVGHMAIAEYGLLLFRIRGRAESDLKLIPGRFRKGYGKGTQPNPDPEKNLSPEDLIGKLEEVWKTSREELPSIAPEVFMEPVDAPYAAYPTKLGAVMFAPLHTQLHAGQVGVIRRGLGLDPIR